MLKKDTLPSWVYTIPEGQNRDELIDIMIKISEWQKTKCLIADGLIGIRSWHNRDENLILLASRFRHICEVTGLTYLQSYKQIVTFIG